MTRKRKIRVSDSGKERRVGDGRSGLYIRNATAPSDGVSETAEIESVKQKPSLPSLKFMERKQIAGEWI